MDPKNPKDRFPLSATLVGTTGKYLKQDLVVEALAFEDEVIQLRMPIKIDLEVKEAPPDVRGNTAQGGTKVVTLETGATINVPMFIHAGDIVRINTETGTYVERV